MRRHDLLRLVIIAKSIVKERSLLSDERLQALEQRHVLLGLLLVHVLNQEVDEVLVHPAGAQEIIRQSLVELLPTVSP